MGILELFSPKPKIRCRLRGRLVAHTPEEEVRQSYLAHLIDRCGFPEGLIAVETSLSLFVPPGVRAPKRRLDIVLFSGNQPLMLIECKASKLNSKTEQQALGYNFFVKAPYLCLINSLERRYGSYTECSGWVFSEMAPSFLQEN